jgi:CheY-like chemotaxis protein
VKRILVVDDDRDICHLLKGILEAHHFVVATAINGREAVAQVEAEVPDGIFMDVRMPVMDGFLALQAIRREHPQLPIIMTSASRTSEIAEKVRAYGASGYLPKPIDLRQLRAVLRDSFGAPA